MLQSFTFWLSVLAALVVYLCASVGWRWRRQAAEQRRIERERTGKAFDVSAIAPQVQRVRKDPLAIVRARPHFARYRAGLVNVARKMVTRLPFFQPEDQKHGLETLRGSKS
jgi:hypothetical protein